MHDIETRCWLANQFGKLPKKWHWKIVLTSVLDFQEGQPHATKATLHLTVSDKQSHCCSVGRASTSPSAAGTAAAS